MTAWECSVHTHTTFCDGKGTPEEMAAAAYAAGVRYYGFSGHSFSPNPADEGYTLPENTEVYREKVLGLRAHYAGRMEILLGIEWDSWTAGSPAGYDYWIGSVHAVRDAEGHYYAVDASPETLKAYIAWMCGGDGLLAAESYYEGVADMASRKPTILGHIDLITKFRSYGYIDETDRRYRTAALTALHAADASATLLEINTGAMSRRWRRTPYPSMFLLREWRTMGGRVIITSDAHSPGAIVYGYGAAAQLAREAGFRTGVALTMGGAVEYPL